MPRSKLKFNGIITKKMDFLYFKNILPCSPVKVPQRVGMLGALDTPKVSDKHLVTRLPSVPSPPVPPIILFTDAVSVAGPVITKVSKSSRIWQILVLALQI